MTNAKPLSPAQINMLRAVVDAGGTVPMTFRAKGCNVKALSSLHRLGLLDRDDGKDVQATSYLVNDAGLAALFGSVKVE